MDDSPHRTWPSEDRHSAPTKAMARPVPEQLPKAFIDAWVQGCAKVGLTGLGSLMAASTKHVCGPTLCRLVQLMYEASVAAAHVVLQPRVREGSPTEFEVWQKEVNWATRRHHGALALLRRWGILVGQSTQDAGPLRIAPLSQATRSAFERLLRPSAHAWVLNLHGAQTLREWVAQMEASLADLHTMQLPGMRANDSSGRTHIAMLTPPCPALPMGCNGSPETDHSICSIYSMYSIYSIYSLYSIYTIYSIYIYYT